jgi:hypothetical protein
MALTKISRGLLNTGVSDSSDATFLTVDSSENATLAGNLTVSGNLTVTGTSTVVDTVTMNAQNAVIFEGATADAYETTLSIVDPTADHTQYLINQGGYVPVLAAVSTTAITSTPAELNLIDGGTARGTDALASGDGILINDAGTMKMTNVDTVKTFMGTTTEEIQDIAGAMFTSNTETGITATYQDADGTVDLVVGTLNQNTTGTAATVTGAAQSAITSLGTLTTLTVDDITMNGSAITVGAFGNTARAANFHGGSILVDGGAASEIIIGDGNVAYMSIQTTDDATAMKIRNFTGSADLVTIERATGNMGIGTASPADKLHVVGDIRIDGGNQMTNEIAWFNSSHYLAGIRQASNGSYNDSGGLQFLTSGTSNAAESVKMVIDTQGNVGIGTASPTANLHISGSGSGDGVHMILQNTGNAPAGVRLLSGHGNWEIVNSSTVADCLEFIDDSAGSLTRMMILPTGAVLIGQTAQTGYGFAENLVVGGGTGVSNQGITIQSAQNSQGNLAFNRDNGTTAYGRISYQHGSNYMGFMTNNAERLRISSGGRQTYDGSSTANAHANFVGEVGASFKALAFERTNGGGEVGTIVTNASSTSYNTSSDYRLKENVDYTWDATTRLKQLKPARFNWISDDSNTLIEGFLAHEVSSIVPEAVSGVKDAIDEDGNPDHQGIDQSKLVPLMVKTIQEAMERIETLETSNLDLEEKLNIREGELEQRVHEIEQRLV